MDWGLSGFASAVKGHKPKTAMRTSDEQSNVNADFIIGVLSLVNRLESKISFWS